MLLELLLQLLILLWFLVRCLLMFGPSCDLLRHGEAQWRLPVYVACRIVGMRGRLSLNE